MKRFENYSQDIEYLKQFKSEPLEYQYTVSEIKNRGLRVSVEWRHLGIEKQLNVKIEDMVKDGHSGFFCEEKNHISFPINKIPGLIELLNSIYLKANSKSDSEV